MSFLRRFVRAITPQPAEPPPAPSPALRERAARLGLPYPPKYALRAGEVDVVLLDVPPGAVYPRNLVGLDSAGTRWQIAERPRSYADAAYYTLRANPDGTVDAFTQDGWRRTVDPATGTIVRETQTT
jgi:hypothetical protein